MSKTMPNEIWRTIPSHPKYEASNIGNIRHKERKVNRAFSLCRNYLHVSINIGNSRHKVFSVHRLVAEAFLLSRPDKPWVCHKDGNPTNNCIDNLYYGSALDNAIDKRRLMEVKLKFSDAEVTAMRQDYERGMSTREIARKYGAGKSTVHAYITRLKRRLPYAEGSQGRAWRRQKGTGCKVT